MASGPRNQRKFSVYVVKLDAQRLFERGRCPSPDTKCFYVGSTGISPGERFNRHKAGARYTSTVVRDYGRGLSWGIMRRYDTIERFATRTQAERAERTMLNRLRARSKYKVWGNAKSVRPRKASSGAGS